MHGKRATAADCRAAAATHLEPRTGSVQGEAMSVFVALLRGVNVGKAKRVPMAELRRILAEIGCTDVRTLLNSGNAVFRASSRAPAKLAAAIAAALRVQLGVEVPVIVVPAADLDVIVRDNPLSFADGDHARVLVAFAADARSLAALDAIRPLLAPREQLAVGAKAAYLLCVGGILESRAGEALLGKAGRAVTTRNWATVLKLQALASEPPPRADGQRTPRAR